MPILVHGTLASRERAPRHWNWRAANLWVAAVFCAGWQGRGARTDVKCRAAMAFVCGDCKAANSVQCPVSCWQPDARSDVAFVARRRTKPRAVITDETSTRSAASGVKLAAARAIASAIAALGCGFRNTRAMPTIRLWPTADGSGTHFDQEPPPGKETAPRRARGKEQTN